MYCNLPQFEIWTYFVLWTSGLLYSLYKVHLAGRFLGNVGDGLFVHGWSLLGGKKDDSDYEWTNWYPFLFQVMPWILFHLVVGEFIRFSCKELLSLWHLTLSMLYLLLNFGVVATLFLLVEPCIMYLLLQYRRRSVLYLSGLVLLIVQNIDARWELLDLRHEQWYLMSVSNAWIFMRSQSFCQDRLTSGRVELSLNDIVSLLGYCFYFPVLFLGPVILYNEYESGVQKPYTGLTLQRLKVFVFNLVRYFFWMMFLEMYKHLFFVNAFQTDVRVLKMLGAWEHYGVGFGMAFSFFLKYVVVYGLSCTVARVEHIQAPPHPKCIGRIHLYSDMWRHFDHGMYLFMRNYLYIPTLGSSNPSILRKLVASFSCFLFVYGWHHVYYFVFVWSVLNFLGIVLETLARAVGSLAPYQDCERTLLRTPQNVRRFHALIATPLFIMSVLSNFFFFSGYEVGSFFIQRLVTGSLRENSVLFLFSYCMSQVSIEVKNWELCRRKKL